MGHAGRRALCGWELWGCAAGLPEPEGCRRLGDPVPGAGPALPGPAGHLRAARAGAPSAGPESSSSPFHREHEHLLDYKVRDAHVRYGVFVLIS